MGAAVFQDLSDLGEPSPAESRDQVGGWGGWAAGVSLNFPLLGEKSHGDQWKNVEKYRKIMVTSGQ